LLLGQLLPPGRRQHVRLRPPPALQFAPLASDPPALFQSMQRRKQRPGTDYENTLRHLLDPVRQPHAVQRAELERPENQEVQRSLEKFSGFRHAVMISTFDIDCQYVIPKRWRAQHARSRNRVPESVWPYSSSRLGSRSNGWAREHIVPLIKIAAINP